jgi:hypothetical protein
VFTLLPACAAGISPPVFQLVAEHIHYLGDWYPHLVHRIPVSNCDSVIFQGIEIYCDTVGSADFILTPVTPADALGIIVLRIEVSA